MSISGILRGVELMGTFLKRESRGDTFMPVAKSLALGIAVDDRVSTCLNFWQFAFPDDQFQ
jgi:hypothetical protein